MKIFIRSLTIFVSLNLLYFFISYVLLYFSSYMMKGRISEAQSVALLIRWPKP